MRELLKLLQTDFNMKRFNPPLRPCKYTLKYTEQEKETK